MTSGHAVFRAALAAAALVAACAAAAHPLPSFDEWAMRNLKSYRSADEAARRAAIFNANMAVAAAHNARPGVTFTMGATPFADLEPAEFAAAVGAVARGEAGAAAAPAVPAAPPPPPAVDWRTSGCLHAVRNQGQCGAVWAFAAVEALEAACCLAGRGHGAAVANVTALSIQEVVDCAPSSGGHGCNGGGLPADAWSYAANASGLCTDAAYPYAGKDGSCAAAKCPHRCRPTGVVAVPPDDAAATLGALAARPLVLGVAADSSAFMMYVSGVITSPNCGSNINHMVFAVGYDTTAPVPFVRVMNSWGAAWGELGFARIGTDTSASGASGVCGIFAAPAYVTV